MAMDRAMLVITRRDRNANVHIPQQKSHRYPKKIDKLKWRCEGHGASFMDGRWTQRKTEWRPREDERNRARTLTRWTDDVKHVAGKWVNFALDRNALHPAVDKYSLPHDDGHYQQITRCTKKDRRCNEKKSLQISQLSTLYSITPTTNKNKFSHLS